MAKRAKKTKKPTIDVSRVSEIVGSDLNDLCDAAESAIEEGGGFGWLKPPPRQTLENFWRGALMVPERAVFIGRLDGIIVGSAQLVRPTKNNEAQALSATLTTNFVAPWARGHGLARGLTAMVEDVARRDGFLVLNLDVRETQEAAISLYENAGYVRYAEHPHYARVNDAWVAGYYYYKDLQEAG
ncbi:MAG: GNAT family N-acetyltransferase [Alphaproteobacteria bacterium]|nr:GNAT family N-acetyltransferase [Alphaproteobacteria bacterium]